MYNKCLNKFMSGINKQSSCQSHGGSPGSRRNQSASWRKCTVLCYICPSLNKDRSNTVLHSSIYVSTVLMLNKIVRLNVLLAYYVMLYVYKKI